MAESSPELPKQRPKPQLPASALQDSSSPAPARRIKIKRIVSPAVPAQSAPAAKGHKKQTKRSAFVKSRFFDHQCVEKGKSDGSEGNSSDDGDQSDLSCVSAGQYHPNAERFEYLEGLGSQSHMPPPLQLTRFMEEARSPLVDRLEKRILAEKAERKARREAELAKVREAALSRKAAVHEAASADVPAPPVTTLTEAAVTDVPAPPVTYPKATVHEAASADVPAPPVTSPKATVHEAASTDVPAPPVTYPILT